ncbi:uncharacterized protein LOC118463725 [Anopheles albimanus]|uniref:Uncharacterized protein n=1 Tax=Anopheles albimanus TaxID=7167 RepID=A0A182FV33_ANOAL|nr:uncharacterized protein LOC118463725 [Anopheles albimanus]
MVFASLLTAVLIISIGGAPGIQGSYVELMTPNENIIHHGLKVVHREEHSAEHLQPPQHFYHQHPPASGEYQQSEESHFHSSPPAGHTQLFRPTVQQQYVVQSGYNVGSLQEAQEHQPSAASAQQQLQYKQRQPALPYNNERLHVTVDYPRTAASHSHPIPASHQPLEPKKNYRDLIPKSIAPKLNPLHHSFHQKRNFVPLHHITRQVPVPSARHAAPSHAAHQQHPQQMKAALVPSKH